MGKIEVRTDSTPPIPEDIKNVFRHIAAYGTYTLDDWKAILKWHEDEMEGGIEDALWHERIGSE